MNLTLTLTAETFPPHLMKAPAAVETERCQDIVLYERYSGSLRVVPASNNFQTCAGGNVPVKTIVQHKTEKKKHLTHAHTPGTLRAINAF